MEKDIRIKRLYYDGKLTPDRPCPKCRSKYWLRGGTILTWVCPLCGVSVYTSKTTALDLIDKNIYKMPINM